MSYVEFMLFCFIVLSARQCQMLISKDDPGGSYAIDLMAAVLATILFFGFFNTVWFAWNFLASSL